MTDKKFQRWYVSARMYASKMAYPDLPKTPGDDWVKLYKSGLSPQEAVIKLSPTS